MADNRIVKITDNVQGGYPGQNDYINLNPAFGISNMGRALSIPVQLGNKALDMYYATSKDNKNSSKPKPDKKHIIEKSDEEWVERPLIRNHTFFNARGNVFSQIIEGFADQMKSDVRYWQNGLRALIGTTPKHFNYKGLPSIDADRSNHLKGSYTADQMNPVYLSQILPKQAKPIISQIVSMIPDNEHRKYIENNNQGVTGAIPLPSPKQYFDGLYDEVGGLEGLRRARINSSRFDKPQDRFDFNKAINAWDKLMAESGEYVNRYGTLKDEDNNAQQYDEMYKRAYPYPTGTMVIDQIENLPTLGIREQAKGNMSRAGYMQPNKDGSILLSLIDHKKPKSKQQNDEAFTLHHEYMHGLQGSTKADDEGNSRLKVLYPLWRLYTNEDHNPYAGDPLEAEANLSATRAMYGKPIINQKDARDFMNWVDKNKSSLYDSESSVNNPILNYLKKPTPAKRKTLTELMQLIVQNPNSNEEQSYV